VIKRNATQQESGVEKSRYLATHHYTALLGSRQWPRVMPSEVTASSFDSAGLQAHPITPSGQNHC